VFESVFKEFGLPRAIRTDNGVPFASPNSLFTWEDSNCGIPSMQNAFEISAEFQAFS